jgi:hypothetical protein
MFRLGTYVQKDFPLMDEALLLTSEEAVACSRCKGTMYILTA